MTADDRPRPRGLRTRVLHDHAPSDRGAVSTPIVHSATFTTHHTDELLEEMHRGPAGAFYQRYGHPTLHAVEDRLARIEGAGAALLFSSGMAATSATFLGRLRPGDHVVSIREAYGGTLELLAWGERHAGWTCTRVGARDVGAWESAFRPETRLFHVESPTNPTVVVLDLERAARLAHARGALLSVDNTFASPVGQQPLRWGADLVIYSATKSIGGHSDLLAGAVLGSPETLEPLWAMRRIMGAVPDPTTAWLIERSLKTLPLRVEAMNATALALAERLAGHPGVRRVDYPGLAAHPEHALARRQMTLGFGPIVSLELGGRARARAFVEALELFGNGPSLGGVESLASLPALLSHRRMTPEERAAAGISDGLVRLSVGLEDLEDLWQDLDRALTRAPEPGP